jgi:hypothetical protein
LETTTYIGSELYEKYDGKVAESQEFGKSEEDACGIQRIWEIGAIIKAEKKSAGSGVFGRNQSL